MGSNGSEDFLIIFFGGGGYSVDCRSDTDNNPPYPEWMEGEQPSYFIEGLGNDNLDPFTLSRTFIPFPVVVIPSTNGESLYADANGNYQISWIANGADEVIVEIHFYLESEQAYIVCYPPAGASSLLVSQDWINDYSLGGAGSIGIWSTSGESIQVGSTWIRTEAARIIATSANFVI